MKQTVSLTCKVTPNAKRSECLGWEQDESGRPMLRVKLSAAPKEGEANRELILFLAKWLKVPKSQIVLVQGEQSRVKRLQIPAEAQSRLPEVNF